ncbi:acyl-CoA dehydrogenase NM domain-like protein [Rhizoclosmatium globosum]|uniref:Acyl-CoA dehydrogenase NM domain-like protein n=1 Tax=Rhizoclosmatium globosum TaxID=329046 RepID=A0A1Y2CQ34_9FUNG|nr:acyl-CoA dehydrogenase NM domain-like protein [Rhizoclosmatium globosum]|eukprot:ORY49046.1 acyl-CoA dehydrogenase NM domain-like protein [Rhizoclosmatium globosum]
MSKTFSRDEVSRHNKADDLWIVIDSVVYDLTRFLPAHPGGEHVLIEVAGKDATEEFYSLHRHAILQKFSKFAIGSVTGEKPKIQQDLGSMSKVPYAESSFWMGSKTPYYNESHVAYRKAVREFVDTQLRPHAQEYEDNGGKIDIALYKAMGKFGLLASRIGPGLHLKFVPSLPAGVKPDQFDYFHEMIAHEEIARLGSPSFSDGLGGGMVIGLPPVLAFGSKEMVQKVAPAVLMGEKRICLAITEPYAGSDVANIRCTAKKTPDGKHYIVNGVKKWITNGHFSDYFVTAVRTGGAGHSGVSMLLIERCEGLETKQMKTAYSSAAGTAYVTYDNVKVPVENLIGTENQGFPVIMFNFNHERWLIIAAVNRGSRLVTEESFKWAVQRKVFGKPLIEQPVIRFKLAKMISEVESIQNWLESITYNMTKMSYKEQSLHLAGPIALLKYQSTRVAHDVSDDAVQILGGRAITKTGLGSVVEAFQRTYKYGSILGGSEEIMADLGVRMALKSFPKTARL